MRLTTVSQINLFDHESAQCLYPYQLNKIISNKWMNSLILELAAELKCGLTANTYHYNREENPRRPM